MFLPDEKIRHDLDREIKTAKSLLEDLEELRQWLQQNIDSGRFETIKSQTTALLKSANMEFHRENYVAYFLADHGIPNVGFYGKDGYRTMSIMRYINASIEISELKGLVDFIEQGTIAGQAIEDMHKSNNEKS